MGKEKGGGGGVGVTRGGYCGGERCLGIGDGEGSSVSGVFKDVTTSDKCLIRNVKVHTFNFLHLKKTGGESEGGSWDVTFFS